MKIDVLGFKRASSLMWCRATECMFNGLGQKQLCTPSGLHM